MARSLWRYFPCIDLWRLENRWLPLRPPLGPSPLLPVSFVCPATKPHRPPSDPSYPSCLRAILPLSVTDGLERISFKCSFRGDWYSIRLTTSTTFRSLRRQLEEQFQCKLRVKYLDSDRDQVAMRREADFQQCLSEASRKGRMRIKLYLYEKDGSNSVSSHGGGRSSLQNSEELTTSAGGHGGSKKSKSSRKQQPNAQLVADMFGMFEFILDPAIVINEQGIMQYVNKRVESVLGYTQAEMIGRNVDILTTEDTRPYHDTYLRNYLRTGVSRIIGKGRDVIAVKKDGTIIPVNLELTEKSTGAGLYFIGILKEARNQAQEKSLIQMEREVLDNLSVPAIIIDHQGLINGFNKAAQEFLGFSLVDVIGKNVNILMSSPHREAHDGYLKAYMETGVAKIIGLGRNVVAQHRDGTLIPIFLTVTEKRDKEKRFFTGVMQESRTATIAPISKASSSASRGPPIVNLQ